MQKERNLTQPTIDLYLSLVLPIYTLIQFSLFNFLLLLFYILIHLYFIYLFIYLFVCLFVCLFVFYCWCDNRTVFTNRIHVNVNVK